MLQADQYAKGLLACGCVPGKDALCSMGVSSLEPISLFVAAASIGVGFGVFNFITLFYYTITLDFAKCYAKSHYVGISLKQ